MRLKLLTPKFKPQKLTCNNFSKILLADTPQFKTKFLPNLTKVFVTNSIHLPMDDPNFFEEPPAIFNQLLSTFNPKEDFFADENKENHRPSSYLMTANSDQKFSNSENLKPTTIFPITQNRYPSPTE